MPNIRVLATGLEFPEGPVAMPTARCCWSKSGGNG